MSIITGCYQTKVGSIIHEKTRKIALMSSRTDKLTTRSLLKTDKVSLYLSERPDSHASEFATTELAGHRSWLLGDLNYVDPEHVPDFKKYVGLPAERIKVPGRWVLIEHNTLYDNLSLTTDLWGLLWLYIAETTDGFIFSSDFGALIWMLDSQPLIDINSCVLELVLGYSLGNKSVYNGVSMAPAGTRISFTDLKMKQETVQPAIYSDTYAGVSIKNKMNRLDEIWGVTEQRYFRAYSNRLTVSISAGIDSRHALAILRRSNIHAEYLTFGDPDSTEVRTSQLNCGRVGIKNKTYNFSESKWDEWRSCISQLGNSGIVQLAGWADQWHQHVAGFGSSLVTGIFGGPLTGTHLIPSNHERHNWIRNWIDYSVATYWRSQDSLLHPIWISWIENDLEELMKAELIGVEFSMPHQQAIHLDYYGRQRRWTGAQPELAARFVTPVPYLYSWEFIDFWSSQDFEALTKQSLYLAYARSRFPELFPKWERRPGLLWRAVRRFRSEVLSRNTIGEGMHQSVINHRQILQQNKQNIYELTHKVRDIAEKIIDCDKLLSQLEEIVSGKRKSADGQQIIRCVNLMHLLAIRH